jgi:putative endonuclease
MEYFVYILKSLKDGRFYKGQTQNIEKRLLEHNSGKTKSTKGNVPWESVYFESLKLKEEALLREKHFKTGIGRAFLNKNFNK